MWNLNIANDESFRKKKIAWENKRERKSSQEIKINVIIFIYITLTENERDRGAIRKEKGFYGR